MKDALDRSELTLVGHPYAPIGMGEHVRCTYRALRDVAVRPGVVDIYELNQPDGDLEAEFAAVMRRDLGALSIYHINGDEVAQSTAHLRQRSVKVGYSIVYPAWELSNYPAEWAKQLDTFDEIWAPSQFIYDCLVRACKRPVVHMPLACEVVFSSFLGRRYFGIPEADYIFLFFFDLRSFTTRKNCKAVIEAFRGLIAKRPTARAKLVLKVNSGSHDSHVLRELRAQIDDLHERVLIIDRGMSDNEIKGLVRCCDCFVSLHRSEGYGRGIAEAMFLGKPVIATDYSGNVDFMSPDTSLPVRYTLIPVAERAYPYWEGQVWADPDVEQASDYMVKLTDDPQHGRDIGKRASSHIQTRFGYRVTGLRYRKRLDEIRENRR